MQQIWDTPDINLVIDVEPKEAQALIGLIEIMFEEWYVAKHECEGKLKELEGLLGKENAMKEQAAFSPSDDQAAAPNFDRG